jgi:hypothetical protein
MNNEQEAAELLSARTRGAILATGPVLATKLLKSEKTVKRDVHRRT